MALFPKMPAKKPVPQKAEGNARHDPAPRPGGDPGWRQSKAGGITITGFGLVEASPTRRVIEVTHANAGMCAVLENAVLLFASGHAGEARTLLADGVESDSEAKRSSLAWLALFDLLQRAGDRHAFEQLALQYVVQFERSAPTWDDRIRPAVSAKPAAGGYVGVTGMLSAASAPQLEALRRAVAKNASQARFDLAAITGFDDAGARILAEILAEARRRQYPLRLQRSEKLRQSLEAAVAKGAAGGEGAWLLSLELLQWQNDRAAFDDRAVDYAVTFEVSPPSWEPPVLPQTDVERAVDSASAAASRDENDAPSADAGREMLAWTGVVAGAHPEQIGKLTQHADGREVVQVDLTQVERIDFVGAGAVFNAVKALEEHRKSVQIFGATPIIRAMLLLIGISAGHFFKKAQ
jgi:anti-anti-sigma regulatory factor